MTKKQAPLEKTNSINNGSASEANGKSAPEKRELTKPERIQKKRIG